ncbi:MAG: glycosyltransferase [Lachnospiraceae bacterium]|nr:glycosyltransferase [Lachnospiraceae bacterium]
MSEKLKSDLTDANAKNALNIPNNAINNNSTARKIAFYIGSLNKGGAERVFVNLAEYFLSRGYKVVMVTQYQKEDEYILDSNIKRVISDITPEETTGSRMRNFYRRMKKLRNVWKLEQPDLVLSCVGKNNFMTVVTTMFTKTKPVVSVVGEAKEEYPNALMKALANLLFPCAAGVILQTERSREFFNKKVRKTTVILPNSLNPLFIRPRFSGERQKRLVSVGRLDANKNHEMMVRAFANLTDKYPEYTLTIYGEGELREHLLKLIESLNLTEKVSLPGIIPNVADNIEKAALFLHTSYSEGVSNAIIEALALGLPVIATDVPSGGTVELIRHNENGLIIPPGDQTALEAAIDTVLSDNALAEKLGNEACKIQDKLAPEKVNAEWERYFAKLWHNQ